MSKKVVEKKRADLVLQSVFQKYLGFQDNLIARQYKQK